MISAAAYAGSVMPRPAKTEDGAKVADALRSLRSAADMTQEQAAKQVGLTLSGYRNYEQGRRYLRVDQLDRFARAFGVTPEALASRIGLSSTTEARTMSFSADLEVFQNQLAALPPELATSLLEMWRASLAMAREVRKLREN